MLSSRAERTYNHCSTRTGEANGFESSSQERAIDVVAHGHGVRRAIFRYHRNFLDAVRDEAMNDALIARAGRGPHHHSPGRCLLGGVTTYAANVEADEAVPRYYPYVARAGLGAPRQCRVESEPAEHRLRVCLPARLGYLVAVHLGAAQNAKRRRLIRTNSRHLGQGRFRKPVSPWPRISRTCHRVKLRRGANRLQPCARPAVGRSLSVHASWPSWRALRDERGRSRSSLRGLTLDPRKRARSAWCRSTRALGGAALALVLFVYDRVGQRCVDGRSVGAVQESDRDLQQPCWLLPLDPSGSA